MKLPEFNFNRKFWIGVGIASAAAIGWGLCVKIIPASTVGVAEREE